VFDDIWRGFTCNGRNHSPLDRAAEYLQNRRGGQRARIFYAAISNDTILYLLHFYGAVLDPVTDEVSAVDDFGSFAILGHRSGVARNQGDTAT